MWEGNSSKINKTEITHQKALNIYLSLALLSVLLVVLHVLSSFTMRSLGLHIPGHNGLVWMPLLIIGKMKWKTKISATYMAAVSTIVIIGITPMLGAAQMGGMWFLPFLRYGIPAIVLDALWPLFEKFSKKPFTNLIAITSLAALAHLSKVPFSMITWHFGFGHYVITHFTLSTIFLLYLTFGVAGGIVGFLVGRYHPSTKTKGV